MPLTPERGQARQGRTRGPSAFSWLENVLWGPSQHLTGHPRKSLRNSKAYSGRHTIRVNRSLECSHITGVSRLPVFFLIRLFVTKRFSNPSDDAVTTRFSNPLSFLL